MPLILALVALLLCAAPASAATFTVPGAPGPGPSKYDRVFVERFGPADAERVLILTPGFVGGAGDFALVGRELARRVPDLQVWAVDRRTQAFEDTSGFASGDPQRAFDYYLGGGGFKPVSGTDVPYVRDWGLALVMGDLQRVVRRARDGGRRKVILGGHSLGGSLTVAYASWDFAGRPGHRDLDGMVLIDGGLLGTFTTPNLAGVKRRLAELRTADPFVDLLGLGIPWAVGVFTGIGGQAALRDPEGRSALAESPLLPAFVKPPFPVTNEGLIGRVFDRDTSPRGFELIRVRAGRLAAGGEVRGWQDGEVTPVQNLAAFLGRQPVNGIEWYFPERLRLDVDGASGLRGRRDPINRLLGLRPFHARSIDLPLYAFETDLTKGRVLRGARRLIERSEIPRRSAVLVDRGRSTSHLDPLTAAPRTNDFLKTVAPFLRGLR
jgi:pimeloyl-ACP methyl ester carboxylesterase